jgi:hypothetical protein
MKRSDIQKKGLSTSKRQRRERVGPLNSAASVSKFMAKCIRRACWAGQGGGESSANQQYKLVMMSSMLIKALEVSEIEKRLTKIEEALNVK